MSAGDLPLQRGDSDLHAAAQLRRRPDPLAAAVRLAGLVDDWHVDEPAAEPPVDRGIGCWPPFVVDQVVEDPCRCPVGAVCDEDGCAHCRQLDPALPCPHDPYVDEDQVVDAGDVEAIALEDRVVEPMTSEQAAAEVARVEAAHVQLVAGDGCADCDGWGCEDGGDPCPGCGGTGHAVREAAGPVHVVTLDGRPLHWLAGGHDERSRDYGVRRLMGGSVPLHDFLRPIGPILDQGAEGECVGCGVVDATNSLRKAAGSSHAELLTIDDAAAIYRRAQQLDDRPGESYVGTSVLAGLQAGVERGLFAGYSWCFGTRDIAQAVLQVGPVVIGIPWLSGMGDTGPGGQVVVEGDELGVGHVLLVVGIRLKGPQGQAGPFFVWQNSWGAGYGDQGLGYIHHRDLAALLHDQGEAAVINGASV